MEIHEKDGVSFQLNVDDLTAYVVDSPNASGYIVIPRHFRFQKKNFIVTTIKSNAFYENTIDCITFSNNSEVVTFEDEAFQNSSIKKLQIPPKLKVIQYKSFFMLKNLIEFDVSPKNNLFSFYNNELLIGKSDENQSSFDILYLGRSDLNEVIIPSSIRVIKRYAFGESPNLESIKFEENSQLEYIEGWVLCEKLQKFEIPKNLKSTENDAFNYAYSLVDVEVSPENKVYKWMNKTFLIRNENEKQMIAFCRRDATEFEIPRYINEIDPYAFTKCENLFSISFEDNSSLEVINENAFENVPGQENIIIPPSVKIVRSYAFSYMENLVSIEFLSNEIEIEENCFYGSDNLTSISFTKAKKIIFNDSFMETMKIYIRKDTDISGSFVDENKEYIEIIEGLNDEINNNNRENIEKQEKNDILTVEKELSDTIQETNSNSSKCCLLI